MNIIGTIFIAIVCGFGLWKIHELLFGNKKLENIKKELQREQSEKILLNQFMGDFTYKAIQKQDHYETAPKEIFEFLIANYKEWVEEKINKK